MNQQKKAITALSKKKGIVGKAGKKALGKTKC